MRAAINTAYAGSKRLGSVVVTDLGPAIAAFAIIVSAGFYANSVLTLTLANLVTSTAG
ncbi:hypothetical protein J2T09_003498 [Neorhizobium huautlense]|uniref:Uncharacterized protein n=1 Tax=Neorhizobium huautlense TaxID=67774 RepID=A0ABT9PW39_9HYPH|nr:hypothetical protein [Neorhizobium huautlense]